MHVTPGYPLYCEEASSRKYFYYPPSGGGYPNGWLWIDGNQHATATWWTWDTLIEARMNRPVAVDIRLEGWYSAATRNGAVSARFRNDSSAAILGRAILVLTEDSLYYPAPNYDSTHNHVARDYLPDQNGLGLSLPAGDSAIVNQPFTLAPDWVMDKCRILAWVQSDSAQPDSTKNIWQGAMVSISSLSVHEASSETSDALFEIAPNPCRNSVRLTCPALAGHRFAVSFYDPAGRLIRRLPSSGISSMTWDLNDQTGNRVGPGLYICVIESPSFRASKTIVVQ
jgi:hypothetical protein